VIQPKKDCLCNFLLQTGSA